MPHELPQQAGAPASAYEGRDLEAMAFARNYHAAIARYFRPVLRGTIAEIGAGAGDFTEVLLRPEVRRLYALEPAANLQARLATRFAAEPRVVPMPKPLGEVQEALEPLDAIVYCNVLEHIEDDFGEVRRAVQALAPGGSLCVFVPALPWLMSDFDRSIGHFRRYTKARLKALTAASGLAPQALRWFDSAGIVPWLVSMKWLRRGLDAGAVRAYDRWVVPWLMPFESRVAPPLGRNLLMVARRTGTG